MTAATDPTPSAASAARSASTETDKDVGIDQLSFEAAFDALNELVAKLEAGGLSLDDSLAMHARGVALADRCGTLLEGAELRIREVDAAGEDAGPLDAS